VNCELVTKRNRPFALDSFASPMRGFSYSSAVLKRELGEKGTHAVKFNCSLCCGVSAILCFTSPGLRKAACVSQAPRVAEQCTRLEHCRKGASSPNLFEANCRTHQYLALCRPTVLTVCISTLQSIQVGMCRQTGFPTTGSDKARLSCPAK
jgi:hypothetical protein